MGKLDDLIQRELGVAITHSFNPLVSSVGLTVVKILNNNPDRIALTIVNTSINAIYLLPEPEVSATRGIVLAPSGDSISLNWKEDYHLVGAAWFAVAAGANSTLLVLSLEALGG